MKVEVGNATKCSALNPDGTPNGWFLGSSRFIREPSLRQCDAIEMKWSIHPKGYDSGVKPCASGLGISILIEGRFWFAIRENDDGAWQEFSLEHLGDFLISRGGSEHRYRAVEDCTLLTVRLTPPMSGHSQ